MSEIKTLLNQSSHYFVGRIFIMAAGLISFPILTRILSVDDYGILGLISITLFLVNAITKLGAPNAIVRFYAEFKAERRLAQFYSTIFSGSLLSATVVAALFFVTIQFISDKFIDNNFVSLLSLCSILIFTKCATDTLTSFLRAEQRTRLYNLIMIVSRYGSLALSIFLVFFVVKGLYGFYVGQIVWSIAIFCLLLYIYRHRIKIGAKCFSPPVLKQSIKFGFPLVWAELGHLVLNYADRYLIHLYLGATSLGLYTAGYNLSTYLTDVIKYPIIYAMMPIYMNMLVNMGEQQTKEFFTKLFTYFLLIMLPSVFGLIAVGKDLISFLASSKYAEAHLILPYVVIGQAIYACTIILETGLLISRKTQVITYVMAGVCALNIVLNMILIPRYGILGAAQATLISCILYTVVITFYAFKEFRFRIDYPRILLYLVVAVAMYLAISAVDVGSPCGNLVTKIPAGVVVYSLFVLGFDKNLRAKSVEMLQCVNKRFTTFSLGK